MISSNTYEEVYQILKSMDKVSVMKIPENILKNIIEKRNPKFKTKIDNNDLFKQENMSIQAMDLLCWITYNYWMNDHERSEIDKINNEFYIELEKERCKKYNSDLLLKKERQTNNDRKMNALIIVEKKGIIKNIIDKIKKLFRNSK